MDQVDDRPDKGAVDRSKAPFTLVDGPAHVPAPDDSPLAGWYEAVFATVDGQQIRRYLSDTGRAKVLTRRGEGLIDFTAEEFDLWTAPPDADAIESRYDAEAGQGA